VAKKPPLSKIGWTGSIRVTTLGPDGKPVESVTEFAPDELRRQGLEEARTKAAVLKRQRLAVVYSVVKKDIGKMSDDKCAEKHFSAVNIALTATARDVKADIIRKESDYPAVSVDARRFVEPAIQKRQRDEMNKVQKILAPYETKPALAQVIARMRRKGDSPL
jgi:hypothetical protein